jgi:cell division protein FtsB
MNYWVAICRFAWALLAVLCVVGFFCFFVPKYKRIRDLHEQNLQVEEQNRALEERIRTLRINREKFASDPSFVERSAREMGMVKPDETIFKFVSNGPAGTASTPR